MYPPPRLFCQALSLFDTYFIFFHKTGRDFLSEHTKHGRCTLTHICRVSITIKLLLLCALAREELLRELCHRAGQQEQGHEVRNAHQSVEGVGDAPQQAQIDRRAQNGHEGVDHEEGADHFVGVEQELDAPGAVETPADDSGECKAAERHRRKDGRPAVKPEMVSSAPAALP